MKLYYDTLFMKQQIMVQYHKSQLIIYIYNILVELQDFLTFIAIIYLIIYIFKIGII